MCKIKIENSKPKNAQEISNSNLKNKNELESKFKVLNKFNSKLKPDNVTNKLVVTTHYSLNIIPFIT
jgi:hypothetical protein